MHPLSVHNPAFFSCILSCIARHRQAPPWPERHARYLLLRLLRARNEAGGVSGGAWCGVEIHSAKVLDSTSAVVLRDSEAGRDRATDSCGLGCDDAYSTKRLTADQAAARTASALADDEFGESNGARVGSHRSGRSCSRGAVEAACDFGVMGGALPESGNCNESVVESSSLAAAIAAGCQAEGEIRLEDTGGSYMDILSKGVTEEGFSISASAAQGAVAEGIWANGRRSRAPRRVSTVDGVETWTCAAPNAVALRRDDSAFSIIDSDGTGDFEGIAAGVEEVAWDVEAGEVVDANVAEMAALRAVYLRRVQPSRGSLNRRAQSAGTALLRSDLGSALFTRLRVLDSALAA
jgi:hypothetical protein